ncbi:uncharacterized protein LOC119615976 isoform X5 [Lucilia sericata]|uniref:uncharacterized protein LOC119615976 isoform X5 n=1 Tax=Lucilia sericata TaxID=13632 RepID=UPI0018A86617|nr:uncharacterized protein LOC119615976 isoform X5 [Lucilia sericata]XP_037827995.1 uncharacterized protein LOC119615976 isoform X5 [Lucilia sericata]
MVIGNQDTGGTNNGSHPSGIPQDQIDNIMSGIANTGDVKMNNHRKKLRQRFDIIKKLGQGTYGKVQLGINKETGQEVAIKTIKKCKIEAESDLVRIRREVQIMSSVQHPNIIHIYEVFENREKMVLVMEFAAGGELYDYLSERKVLSEEEARRIFRQVATAVYYCHKHKICHRDLKLENILLDEHGNAKIADFGLSNVFTEQCLLATFCGSPLYASPEIVEGTPYHGPEVDCWSLGVLLYTLVYGSMPFDGSNFKRLVKQISQGDYYEPKKPSRASSLIREMLTVCPRKRATIEQICSHWWVNENDNVSCLELAEDLANQTPVRLDVLLSLTPVAVTAEQLVVPSADGGNSAGKNAVIPRSHSVGSIRDVVPNTEAERRILDMVAAGGEAALMPSPTRTITPAQSPLQTKRKLENTISTDNAVGVALKKKDKTEDSATNVLTNELVTGGLGASGSRVTTTSLVEESVPMETDEMAAAKKEEFSTKDMELVDDLCEQLIQDKNANIGKEKSNVLGMLADNNNVDTVEDSPEKTKGATKVIKKFVNKHKTADLVNVIGQIDPDEPKSLKTQINPDSVVSTATSGGPQFVRKCSLQDESPLNKFNAERRKSRILETAEKFQQMNASNTNTGDKGKKFIIPGVSVGNFKKEYERKASTGTGNQGQQLTAGERRALEQVAAAAAAATTTGENESPPCESIDPVPVEASDSKASVTSFSLDEARRSMENSIALLRQAQTESSKDVNQLCAKTENIHVSDSQVPKTATDRERKLINARAIIGNAIQPVSQGSGDSPSAGTMKTSTASITLKSATLPRRKTAKTEIQLDIKPPIAEQPSMRFTTEMQHPVADLRSAPPREGPVPYSPIKTTTSQRASSLEPKEHVIPIQRPPSTYARTISNTTNRSGSLSRQSTNDSESDTTTTNMSQATITGSSQPIKKSPREFIIPIAVEGGGFITPREGSIEPSESSHTTGTTSSRSTFTRLRPTRRIGSLLSETGVDEGSPFQKLRTSSSIRDGDDDTRFTLHKLRSSRPVKKISQENDSQSSGEEDDDDGFEILTAENLFSTLLQRVRALTNRMNVNNDITTAFPSSSRLLSNMRQAQSPFWNQEPFGRSKVSYTYSETIEKRQVRLNSAAMGAPWRHSMSRDLGSDMDSMFSRTGATLPRGNKSTETKVAKKCNISTESTAGDMEEPLDLADLDLSRLRLSKKDLETLSNIAPGLPKCFQEQLLAKLPPTQARKLSRTLSVQTNQNCSSVKIYKRSQSSGRNVAPPKAPIDQEDLNEIEGPTTSITEKCSDTTKDKVVATSSTRKVHSKSKSSDDNCKDITTLYNSDISDKYRYYSPYVNKISKDTSQKNASKVGPTEATSGGATFGRPPSGRLSPPPSSESTTRRPTQRRISRLVRPDLFEVPLEEIPGDQNQITNTGQFEADVTDASTKLKNSRQIRNKSVELPSEYTNSSTRNQDALKYNRRSLSRSRDLEEMSKVDKNQLADKILQELQILSSIRSQEVEVHESSTNNDIINEKPISTIKKIKKVKAKEKSTESSTDVDAKNSNTVIKKVKKIVKKSESLSTPVTKDLPSDVPENNNEKNGIISDIPSPKKVSKLKRPKSYPMKDSISSSNTSEIISTNLTSTSKALDSNILTTTEHSNTAGNLSPTEANSPACIAARESRILRPKSYPTSKLIAPKETKLTIRKKINKIEEVSTSTACQNSENTSQVAEATSLGENKVVKVVKKSKFSKSSSISTTTTSTPNTTTSAGEESKESSPVATVQSKGKVGEKKTNKGLLYAIGQKFEKLRASATSNSCANIPTHKKSLEKSSPEKITNKMADVKKTKSLGGNSSSKVTQSSKIGSKAMVSAGTEDCNAEPESAAKPFKSEKRSRIDAMIRNLRERSVPRSQPSVSSESNYIKRAVSVEEMPGTFNKKSVNKVLGLFKRYEKDANPENRVRSVRSTSNIERDICNSSPIYQNADAIRKMNENVEKSSSSVGVNRDSNAIKSCKGSVVCNCHVMMPPASPSCPDCCTKADESGRNLPSAEGNQEKRKGLMLELIKPDKNQQFNTTHNNVRSSKMYPCFNDNEIYSNISPYSKSIHSSSGISSSILTAEKASNNNNSSINKQNNSSNNNNHCSSLHTSQTSGYRTSSTHEVNQNNNLLSPSFENIGNYSSDSRSYQEDCASTSTFLSPTEEAELCFDTWSVCSEDNYRGQRATPSPTVSHLSRASQASSPTRRGDSSEAGESVVDRIKRRSFYCRFNEKKPKRTSSIVGPNAVREYYREQSSASKTRSSTKIATASGEREHSPDITQEFFRPLKLSPIGTELKPPVYRSSFSSSHDYSSASGRPRKSLNDIRTPTSPSCLSERRYASFTNPDNELLTNTSGFSSRFKGNAFDEVPRSGVGASTTYYNTYNPKRRFSFTTNTGISSSGISSNNSPQVDGYATMGRRPIRAYDHRTMSLLDPPNTNTYRHENNTSSSLRDYTSSLSRSNSRYRKSSTPRSPTNI